MLKRLLFGELRICQPELRGPGFDLLIPIPLSEPGRFAIVNAFCSFDHVGHCVLLCLAHVPVGSDSRRLVIVSWLIAAAVVIITVDDPYRDAIIEVLRENDGTKLRSLLRSLSKDDDADARELYEKLIRHPALRDLVPHLGAVTSDKGASR
jgi:hypothetical protein